MQGIEQKYFTFYNNNFTLFSILLSLKAVLVVITLKQNQQQALSSFIGSCIKSVKVPQLKSSSFFISLVLTKVNFLELWLLEELVCISKLFSNSV